MVLVAAVIAFGRFAAENEPKTGIIYLSLGNKEEKTKNVKMSMVGDEIRRLYGHLNGKADCILEWNEGNHFKDPMERTAKGLVWCMRSLKENEIL